MNRLLALTATSLAAVGIAAAPAVAGLAHNASFSHNLPVRVPVDAQAVQGEDHALTVASKTPSRSATSTRGATPSATATGRHSEPGDDRGGHRTTEPGDDRGRGTTEPGDDKGGVRTTAATQPGDDKGGVRTTATTEPGDDKGGVRTTARPSATPSASVDDHGGTGSGSGKGKNGGHDDPTGHH